MSRPSTTCLPLWSAPLGDDWSCLAAAAVNFTVADTRGSGDRALVAIGGCGSLQGSASGDAQRRAAELATAGATGLPVDGVTRFGGYLPASEPGVDDPK